MGHLTKMSGHVCFSVTHLVCAHVCIQIADVVLMRGTLSASHTDVSIVVRYIRRVRPAHLLIGLYCNCKKNPSSRQAATFCQRERWNRRTGHWRTGLDN